MTSRPSGDAPEAHTPPADGAVYQMLASTLLRPFPVDCRDVASAASRVWTRCLAPVVTQAAVVLLPLCMLLLHRALYGATTPIRLGDVRLVRHVLQTLLPGAVLHADLAARLPVGGAAARGAAALFLLVLAANTAVAAAAEGDEQSAVTAAEIERSYAGWQLPPFGTGPGKRGGGAAEEGTLSPEFEVRTGVVVGVEVVGGGTPSPPHGWGCGVL